MYRRHLSRSPLHILPNHFKKVVHLPEKLTFFLPGTHSLCNKKTGPDYALALFVHESNDDEGITD